MEGELRPLEEYKNRFSYTENGLNKQQISENKKRFGANELITVAKTSILWQLLKELLSFFPLLLLFSAAMSWFAHTVSPGEGYNFIAKALFFVVILNTSVSFVQKRKVAQVMSSFAQYIPQNVLVLREAKQQLVSAREIVCGDIIKLAEGDKVPADCVILHSEGVQVDESILTGESVAATKTAYEQTQSGMLFNGTTLLQGNATAMVVRVGENTKLGQIANLTQTVKKRLTPMEKELKYFVQKISAIAITLGVLFFFVGLLYFENPLWTNIIFAIGIIVANVPEGLLATVTVTLALTAKRMASNNAVVKSLESVETLGSCSVICTDKTGTLTKNEMTVRNVFVDLQDIDAANTHEFGPAIHPFTEILATCNTASILEKKHASRAYAGDPTETALLSFVDSYADTKPLRAHFRIHEQKPFNSDDKFMSTALLAENNSEYTTIKGAPEVILKRCTHIHLDGEVIELSAEHITRIREQLQHYQHEGMRVLAAAYQPHNKSFADPQDAVFVGLVALIDPPREQVFDAVAACQQAGIRIIVISGDNQETVSAIARQTGIAQNPHTVTGEQLSKLSDAQLKDVLREYEELIFARTAPEQKLRIVTALQELGERVAVTGDGVNDAPALRRADIGVSMGKNGTDVAKDASDIILLDDNFATIVKAVEQGRAVFDNIKKFITYVLTSNIPQILPFLLYVLLYPRIPLPITVLQILTIDLFTDILPSIALGNEKPEKDVMSRPPRSRAERLVSGKTFARSYGFIGIIEAALAFGAFFIVLFAGGWSWSQTPNVSLYIYATTAFLLTIITAQIGNVLACRTNRQSSLTTFKNKNGWLIAGVAVELLVVVGLFLLPLSGWTQVLQGYYTVSIAEEIIRPLTTGQWLGIWAYMLSAPFVVFFLEEARKWYTRKALRTKLAIHS